MPEGGQADNRDAFPLERLGRLETRADGWDREFQQVRALIHEMNVEARESRIEARVEQEKTRAALGGKVDEVVSETSATKVEVAGLREVASNTRDELKSMRRLVAGGVVTIVAAGIVDRLLG